jgi:hypothetical protein
LHIELLQKVYGIKTATVEIGCDGQEALHNAFEEFPLHPGQSQFYLLTAIQQQLKFSPFKWKHRHVKGPMGKVFGHQLSWWENLNESMDLAAKEHWAETQSLDRPTTATILPFEGWHILYHQ